MSRTCWRLEPFDSRIWNPTAALDKIIFQAQAAKRVEERSWIRKKKEEKDPSDSTVTQENVSATILEQTFCLRFTKPMDLRFQSVDKLPSQGSGVATNQEKALSRSSWLLSFRCEQFSDPGPPKHFFLYLHILDRPTCFLHTFNQSLMLFILKKCKNLL